MSNQEQKIIIFGGSGLLGSAVYRVLLRQGYTNVQTPSRKQINLLNKKELDEYVTSEQPDVIFMLAGLVGGIASNKKYGADFLYQNTLMILNLLESIRIHSPNTKIIYTGSTCIYPKENPQPINEDRFLAGKLESSNIGYAMAKSTGVIACQLYAEQYGIKTILAMPTNMYGPNDNYDLENGHMLAALIKKFMIAKQNNTALEFWGTGEPRRESLYSEDCADSLIYLMNNYDSTEIVNIGTGFDYSIKEYIEILKEVFDYEAGISWDSSKPDGTYEKRTDIVKLLSIYPEYKPRSFKEGVQEILKNSKEIKKIMSS